MSENAVEKNFKDLKERAIEHLSNTYDPDNPPQMDTSSDEAIMESIISGGMQMGPDIFGALSAQVNPNNAVTEAVKEKYKEVKEKMSEYIKNMESTGNIEKDNYKMNTVLGFISQLTLVFHLGSEKEMLDRLEMQADGPNRWDQHIDEIWEMHS